MSNTVRGKAVGRGDWLVCRASFRLRSSLDWTASSQR